MSVVSTSKGQVVVSIGGEKTDRSDGRRQMPRTADLNRLKQQMTGVTTSVAHRVGLIQRYIGGFTYNQTLTRHFDTSMDRPLAAILETARYILHGMYPVRCLEAVFAGIALTQQLRDVDRITLRFKSHIPSLDQMYRHIVLAVRVPSTAAGAAPVWGAIGLSREPALMNKPCRFNSLHELIEDFVKGYSNCTPKHDVMSVSIGLPISHDDWSSAPVCWGYLTVHPRVELADQNTRALEEHVDSKNTSMLIPLWEKYGRLRIAHPTRPGSRLTTPGGPAERKLNGQEDRVDWVEEVVQSVKAHVKLGPEPVVLHNRDGSVRATSTGGKHVRGAQLWKNSSHSLSTASSLSPPSPTRLRGQPAWVTPPTSRSGSSGQSGLPPVLASINTPIAHRNMDTANSASSTSGRHSRPHELLPHANPSARKQKRSRRPTTDPTPGEPLSPLRARLRQRSGSGSSDPTYVQLVGPPPAGMLHPARKGPGTIHRGGQGRGGAAASTAEVGVRVAATAATALLMQHQQ